VSTVVGAGVLEGYSLEKYLAESATFHNRIMKSDMPGLVYIWNAVDPKCRELLPLIEKYEAELKGKVRVTKVDVYKSAGIANRLGANQVPCVVTIKNGKIDRIIKDNICEQELKAI